MPPCCFRLSCVYLEGMEEASIFVHVAVSDISGKVSATYKVTCRKGIPAPPYPSILCLVDILMGLCLQPGRGWRGLPMHLRQPYLRGPWSFQAPLVPPISPGPLCCLGPWFSAQVLDVCLALPLSSPHPSTFTPRKGLLPLPQCAEPRGPQFCVRGPAGSCRRWSVRHTRGSERLPGPTSLSCLAPPPGCWRGPREPRSSVVHPGRPVCLCLRLLAAYLLGVSRLTLSLWSCSGLLCVQSLLFEHSSVGSSKVLDAGAGWPARPHLHAPGHPVSICDS